MILRITDGTTTVDLAGGTDNVYLQDDYVPRAPSVSELEFTAEAMRDGGELIKATRRNVAETIPLAIVGALRSDITDAQHAIEVLLNQAQLHQERGVGAPVYVEYRKADAGDIYRSEILRGVLEPSERTAGEMWWAGGAAAATLGWKRRYYWEGPEVEIPLTNGGEPATGGVTVDNTDDGSYVNWVDIDGDDVAGVLPAPVRLELTNTYDVVHKLGHVFIGHNAFSNPATFGHILEAEDAATSGSVESSASASGGEYVLFQWAHDTEATVLEWSLPSELMSAAGGGHFHMIMRFWLTLNTGIWFRLRIRSQNLPIWASQQFQVDKRYAMTVRSMGVVQLPPWLVGGHDAVDALTLQLLAQKQGGGTLYPDFLQLTPTDSYRVLFQAAGGAGYGQRIVDDGILNLLYVDTGAGTGRRGVFVGRGTRVTLWPGRDQRLYFLTHSATFNTSEIGRTMAVRVYYRPRRLTL